MGIVPNNWPNCAVGRADDTNAQYFFCKTWLLIIFFPHIVYCDGAICIDMMIIVYVDFFYGQREKISKSRF